MANRNSQASLVFAIADLRLGTLQCTNSEVGPIEIITPRDLTTGKIIIFIKLDLVLFSIGKRNKVEK